MCFVNSIYSSPLLLSHSLSPFVLRQPLVAVAASNNKIIIKCPSPPIIASPVLVYFRPNPLSSWRPPSKTLIFLHPKFSSKILLLLLPFLATGDPQASLLQRHRPLLPLHPQRPLLRFPISIRFERLLRHRRASAGGEPPCTRSCSVGPTSPPPTASSGSAPAAAPTGPASSASVICDGCFLRNETAPFFDQATLPGDVAVCGNRTYNATGFAAQVQSLMADLSLATPRVDGFFVAAERGVCIGWLSAWERWVRVDARVFYEVFECEFLQELQDCGSCSSLGFITSVGFFFLINANVI